MSKAPVRHLVFRPDILLPFEIPFKTLKRKILKILNFFWNLGTFSQKLQNFSQVYILRSYFFVMKFDQKFVDKKDVILASFMIIYRLEKWKQF